MGCPFYTILDEWLLNIKDLITGETCLFKIKELNLYQLHSFCLEMSAHCSCTNFYIFQWTNFCLFACFFGMTVWIHGQVNHHGLYYHLPRCSLPMPLDADTS